MSKIISIEEVFEVEVNKEYGSFDGYKVMTEKETIEILIQNGQYCCEDWGILESQDDLNYFVGANLIDIELTCDGINEKVNNIMDNYCELSAQLITFKTDKGNFQVGVYNSHNGYYGHKFYVLRNNKVIDDGHI